MRHRTLFSEINPLYASGKSASNVIRIQLQMNDPVDPVVLRHAVDTTMKRYPYFCVELQKKDGEFVLCENHRPFAVVNSPQGTELNSEASNYHLAAFSWYGDWIQIDVFHALTDGTGAFEVVRTLLYYYCTERYGVSLRREGIRLLGDAIPREEWEDPAACAADISAAAGKPPAPALCPLEEAGLREEREQTVFTIGISESELMRFNRENGGSPATIAALLLCRAIASVHPHASRPIRVSLCVNQRRALRAPLAHQSLVGGAWLEYKPSMRGWSLDRQATAFRGMVLAQTREEHVLADLAAINRNARTLLSLATDQARLQAARQSSDYLKEMLSATVSYVGKANFGDAERYVRDCHTLANAMNEHILIEITAANGRFALDMIQSFSSPIYLQALRKQLEENGVRYDYRGSAPLLLPNVRLPWSE